MTYNLHPLFVHFPIALLVVYSFIKILPLAKYFPQVAWRQIERLLLVVGLAGASVALITGETAEHLVQPSRQLVEMHSTFADISVALYCILLAGELLAFIISKYPSIQSAAQSATAFSKTLSKLSNLLNNKIFGATIAFLALGAITVTGILGGVMVYGTSADPFAATILSVLGIVL